MNLINTCSLEIRPFFNTMSKTFDSTENKKQYNEDIKCYKCMDNTCTDNQKRHINTIDVYGVHIGPFAKV